MTTAQDVQRLYIAYFSRPADPVGLAYWVSQIDGPTKQSIQSVANNFALSPEYTANFTGLSSAQIVNSLYVNLFGRAAEPDGLLYWAGQLTSGAQTIGKIALSIALGAIDTATTKDATALNSKISASTSFTAAIDTTAEITGYNGSAANALARTFLAGVTDAATLATATATAALNATVASVTSVGGGVPGQTFALTTGIDTVVGTVGNDTINATQTSSSTVLGGLDSVDGGAGTDTFNLAETATASSAAFSFNSSSIAINGVETFNFATNGGFTADVSGFSGVTSATFRAAGTANSTVTAGSGTNVNLTVASTANASVTGGNVVTVTAGSGTVGVAGNGLTAVTVNGGGVATIDNNTKTTLTAVTLNSVDATANLTGNGLTSVTLSGATTAARTTNITNLTAGHGLTINAVGTGFTSAGASVQSVVADANATSATINATGGKSSIALTGSTNVTSVTITGSAALTLGALASATAIDGSAASGALTLGSLNAGTVSVTTGSGSDSLTLNATAKATVVTGAGNDTVTLGSVLATNSTVNLGDGNDRLLGVAAQAPVATGIVLDGGAGTDTLSADLVNAGNASFFKNFENLSLNSTTGLDLALLSGNTITALTIDTPSTSATYQNVTATGLTDTYVGVNATTNTLQLNNVSGATDSFAITFNAVDTTTPVAATVGAGTIVAAGIETFNIASGGTKVWNSVTLGADSSAKIVNVTGAANLDLTFAAGFGSSATSTSGVTAIDASAATGNVSINTTNVTSGSSVTLAITTGSGNDTIVTNGKANIVAGDGNNSVTTGGAGNVTTGSGNDTIVLGGASTVISGAGADSITTSAAASTITGGAGVTTLDVHLTTVGGTLTAPVFTTLTDAKQGDILTFFNQGTELFNATRVNVSTATALFGGTVNALDLAVTGNGSVNGIISWFQYNGDTYIVEDNSAAATLATGDIVIRLVGLHDLSTATGAGTNVITLGLGA